MRKNFQEILIDAPLYQKINIDLTSLDILEFDKSANFQSLNERNLAINIFWWGRKTDWDENKLFELQLFIQNPVWLRIELNCLNCKKNRTFLYQNSWIKEKNEVKSFFNLEFICTHCNEEKSYFSFLSKEWKLIKIWEYPSKYESSKLVSNHYRDLLWDKFDEYNKAIIVNSLWFSIASYTYLRRIFENIVIETFEKNEVELWIPKSDFTNEDMKGKINLLKVKLPKFIFDNRWTLYSLLNIHIHTLTEDQAYNSFSFLKKSIEIILEQQIELEKQEKDEEDTKKALDEAHKFFGKDN